jgi:hypothetical protein
VAATEIEPLPKLAPAVWAGAALWIPCLCVMEVIRVQRVGLGMRYDFLRWSTVFPLGMFNVASHDLGIPALDPIAAAFLWVGLAVAILNVAAGAAPLRRESTC